ncbi:hypothetical protein BXY64_1856 [Marinifilum flexuosum]|uniref:DUF3667 domain-containing protein n=1 Tax=Marinifilum flexuosum TaxID=1117708 RepID=A0A419XAP4_9BACT|nr:hypothetical protein BXY64_1856 [Marinifilum flexuosum]
MKCSVCLSEINGKYCSKCGQYYKGERINLTTFLGDLFESIFSLEKSFLRNIRIGLSQPKALVLNYWNGFRKFYYSPGKFFTIASLFLVLHYSIANDFLGTVVTGDISSQFIILLSNILLLTFSSFLLYIQFKKNFFEHLILNIYNVSLWIIVFFPISVILSLTVNNNSIEGCFSTPFHILIIIWNSKAFELTKLKRFLFVTINLLMLYGTLFFLVYMLG